MQDVNSEILKLKALINNKQSTSVFANKANDCNQLVHDGYKLYVNDMTKKFTFTTANTSSPITVDTRTHTLGGVEYIDDLKISDIKTFKQQLDAEVEARIAGDEALDEAKADKEHTHEISDVTGLQTALDNKSDINHTHTSFNENVTLSNANLMFNQSNAAKDQAITFTNNNDLARIRFYNYDGTKEHGALEIATADDQNEPIYLRQYKWNSGPWNKIGREACLLDASGNTSFPGTISSPTITSIQSDITNLASSKADKDHDHEISDVTGLQTALDNKSDINHTHSTFTDITVNTINGIRINNKKAYPAYLGTVPVIPVVKDDGVLEIGKYIDFHTAYDTSQDYAVRLKADSNKLTSTQSIIAPNLKSNNETRLAQCENLISTKADDSMLTALAARVTIVETDKADADHTHDDRYIKTSDVIATGSNINESVTFIQSASNNYLATCSGATAKIIVQQTFYESLSNIELYIHILYFEQRETYFYEYDIATGQVLHNDPSLNHFNITVSHNANVFTFTMHCDVDIPDLNYFSVFMYGDGDEKELRFKYSRETTHPNVLNTNSDAGEAILAHNHDSVYVKNSDLITQRPSTLDRITKMSQTTNNTFDVNDFTDDMIPWNKYTIAPDAAYDNYFAPITYTTTESNATGTIHFQVSTPDVWPEWVLCWRGWHCSLNIQLGAENYKSTVDFYDGVNDVLGFYNATTSGSITGYNFSITWHYNNPDCSVDFTINSTNNSEIFDYFTINLRIWDDYQHYYYLSGILGYVKHSPISNDTTGDPNTHVGCTFVYRYIKEYVYEDVFNANTALGSIIINGILERIYPVGAIYTSRTNTDPSIVLGFGMWTAIENQFMYCTPSNTAHSSGGTRSWSGTDGNDDKVTIYFKGTPSGTITSEGGGQDYMPPYMTIYAWYRTA